MPGPVRTLALVAIAGCGDNLREDGKVPDPPVLPACANPIRGTTISVRKIADIPGESPVLVTAPPADPKLFVVGRGGTIRIIEHEKLLETPFFDIESQILSGGELGLLGLAFHPRYHTNGTFFIYFTRREVGDADFDVRDVVARCVRTTELVADSTSCVEILAIKDRASNHNGGMLEFGPDGYLYIGTGDGGAEADNAQTLLDGTPNVLSVALMGKMLRIDVDRRDPGKEYAVPADNPFLTSGAPEVMALGLRNPWRWSFDSSTGDMWIGDVGQSSIEEINFVAAGELAGKNFGWPMWEASACTIAACTTEGMTFPQGERSHVDPDRYTAIIGGQTYRGSCYPDLVGTYFYADYEGRQFATAAESHGVLTMTDLTPPAGEAFPNEISSIHADARGELYVTTVAPPDGITGSVYRIEVVP